MTALRDPLKAPATRVGRDGRHRPSPEVRFMGRVDKNGPVPAYRPDLGPCWLWTGKQYPNTGYGVFGYDPGVNRRAHRVSYEMHVGPIPEGLTLDHLCRVRHCVNPLHLEPVTMGENVLRGNSVSGRNAAKTHCLKGHPFNEENTYVPSDGSRLCRICRREATRRYWARKSAERKP